MLTVIGLIVIVVGIVLVIRNNKEQAESAVVKISHDVVEKAKAVADVNHDGKVDLQDVKAAVAKVESEAIVVAKEAQVAVEKVKDETKKVAAKVKKATTRKKKNS